MIGNRLRGLDNLYVLRILHTVCFTFSMHNKKIQTHNKIRYKFQKMFYKILSRRKTISEPSGLKLF